MLVEKHDLIHELPEFRDLIHQLKVGDPRFHKLYEEYHELEHEVRRIEDEVEVSSDVYLEDLKKRRLALKDELYAMLRSAQQAAS